MPYFLLGLALLAGSILAVRWFVSAEPAQVVKALRWGLLGLAVALGLLFMFAGRHVLLFFVLPALIPFLLRSRAIWRRAKAAAGPAPDEKNCRVRARAADLGMVLRTGNSRGMPQHGHWKCSSLAKSGSS